jgi:hypothetical protein
LEPSTAAVCKGRSIQSHLLVQKEMITFKQYISEVLKKVDGKWAMVSKKNPSKVLQYYDGEGKPDQEWVNKVEHRV